MIIGLIKLAFNLVFWVFHRLTQ